MSLRMPSGVISFLYLRIRARFFHSGLLGYRSLCLNALRVVPNFRVAMRVVDRVSDVMQSPAPMKQASQMELARAASAGTKNALSTQVHSN